MAEKIVIPPFPDLFEYPTATVNYYVNQGVQWAMANKYLKRHDPCLVDIVYYVERNVSYIPVKGALYEDDLPVGYVLEDFEIKYDKNTWVVDYYISKEEVEEKYGKRFDKWLGLILAGMNEDAVCRHLMHALIEDELRDTLTDLGVRALFTVAALKILWLRTVKEIPPVTFVTRPKEVAPPKPKAFFVPEEITKLAEEIEKIAQKYNVSPLDVINMLTQLFKR